MEWSMEWGCVGSPQSVQIHLIIKEKTRKTRRKIKRHEENGKTLNGTRTHSRACQGHGRAPPTMGRGGPHVQLVMGSAPPGPFASSTLRLLLF